MGDRFWPARRWLADRLVGDHAYSKNVAPSFNYRRHPSGDYGGLLAWSAQPPLRPVERNPQAGIRLHDCKLTDMGRNPGETA